MVLFENSFNFCYASAFFFLFFFFCRAVAYCRRCRCYVVVAVFVFTMCSQNLCTCPKQNSHVIDFIEFPHKFIILIRLVKIKKLKVKKYIKHQITNKERKMLSFSFWVLVSIWVMGYVLWKVIKSHACQRIWLCLVNAIAPPPPLPPC